MTRGIVFVIIQMSLPGSRKMFGDPITYFKKNVSAVAPHKVFYVLYWNYFARFNEMPCEWFPVFCNQCLMLGVVFGLQSTLLVWVLVGSYFIMMWLLHCSSPYEICGFIHSTATRFAASMGDAPGSASLTWVSFTLSSIDRPVSAPYELWWTTLCLGSSWNWSLNDPENPFSHEYPNLGSV